VHGLEVVNLVPHNIIGPRQKYDDPFRNVASIMINLMLQGRQPIIYGDGEQRRCFSFAQDMMDCFVRAGKQKDVVGEVINIGPDEEFVSINELSVMLAEMLDFELKPIYVPDRPQEVKFATCSADKARRMLGYKTKTSLKEGLASIVDYIKARGTRKFRYHIDIEIINEKTPTSWTRRMF
jgi:UDP-glucose 4-epimerase